MAAASTVSMPPLTPDPAIKLNDRVRVPAGHTGSVIGFYRTDVETAVVVLDAGEKHRFPLTEIARVIG